MAVLVRLLTRSISKYGSCCWDWSWIGLTIGTKTEFLEMLRSANIWIGFASVLPVEYGDGVNINTAIVSLVTDGRSAYRIVGSISLVTSMVLYVGIWLNKISGTMRDWAAAFLLSSFIALYRGFAPQKDVEEIILWEHKERMGVDEVR